MTTQPTPPATAPSDYQLIAHLIGIIFFAGDFKAETENERQLEALLIKVGRRYRSWSEIDEIDEIDAVNQNLPAAPSTEPVAKNCLHCDNLRYVDDIRGERIPCPMCSTNPHTDLRAELDAMRKERDHWKANHGNMVEKCAFLSQRPDLPVDRIPAHNALCAELSAMTKERDRFKRAIHAANGCLSDLTAERDSLIGDIQVTQKFHQELIRDLSAEVDKWQAAHADTLAELRKVSEELGALKGERDSLAAEIDALMLEFCPDEMTPEQLANYGRHQRRASPELEAQVNAALAAQGEKP